MGQGAEIKRRREARGWSQAELARRSGTNQQTIGRIETGDPTPNSRALPRVLKVLDIETGVSLPIVPDNRPTGPNDLPVFGTAQGGPGEVLLNNDPIDFVQRPEPLVNVKDAYAMYIVGESMVPAFEQGDLALVDPHLPFRPNDNVIILKDYNEEYAAIVKKLVRTTAELWHLKQYNPEKTFTLSRKEWPLCHVIVGKYSRR